MEVNILGATVQEMEDSVMCIFMLQLIGTVIGAGVDTLPQGRSCGKSGNLHCGQFVYQYDSERPFYYFAGDHYAHYPSYCGHDHWKHSGSGSSGDIHQSLFGPAH